MSRIYINIGSNQGDRAAQIERAVALIANRLDPDGRSEIRLARIIETAPWGFDSPHMFLNLGMMVDGPDADPESLLCSLQEIERSISTGPHRHADGSYADRLIDIDLVAVDEIVYESEKLRLPHPRMSERDFVLAPFAELDSEWRHPISGLTAAAMLERLKTNP